MSAFKDTLKGGTGNSHFNRALFLSFAEDVSLAQRFEFVELKVDDFAVPQRHALGF